MNIKTNKNGQGLLETIVAISVFLTGTLTAVSLVISSLSAGKLSASQIVADNLAWEGVEVARNIRDSNYLAGAGTAWDLGLTGADTTAIAVFDEAANPPHWSLDFTPNTTNDGASRLYRSQGLYKQSAALPPGQATDYYRLITIDPLGTNFMKSVKSQVDWIERGVRRSVVAETKLYNWRAQ
ncbi:hypothetical protein HY224_00445 [Candidatus Uhrbacteria bacterium]|nr:hypothetical protein [Candidatus Uhrbacteria bacterium]